MVMKFIMVSSFMFRVSSVVEQWTVNPLVVCSNQTPGDSLFMISFFIAIQVLLFFAMILHDWIEFKPFTDLKALKKAHSFQERLFGSALNGIMVFIPLVITLLYRHSHLPLWAVLLFVAIYGLITFGTITAWWIPYFTGKYLIDGNKAGFEEYKNTHSFLPDRGGHVIPNTLHVFLHVQVWLCFSIAVCLLFI